jgi:hypothetical protein
MNMNSHDIDKANAVICVNSCSFVTYKALAGLLQSRA